MKTYSYNIWVFFKETKIPKFSLQVTAVEHGLVRSTSVKATSFLLLSPPPPLFFATFELGMLVFKLLCKFLILNLQALV